MFLQLYRGKVRYFRKHHGSMAATIYKLTLTVASLVRLTLSPFALLEPAERRRRHIGLAGNYFRLLSLLLTE
ncbi:MAG: hypothetical protein JSW55_07575 [Chloroflexota bacterium]|nr:MAG: hypothetical protein JSW55_07575 [Chloroflexota bacterium]